MFIASVVSGFTFVAGMRNAPLDEVKSMYAERLRWKSEDYRKPVYYSLTWTKCFAGMLFFNRDCGNYSNGDFHTCIERSGRVNILPYEVWTIMPMTLAGEENI